MSPRRLSNGVGMVFWPSVEVVQVKAFLLLAGAGLCQARAGLRIKSHNGRLMYFSFVFQRGYNDVRHFLGRQTGCLWLLLLLGRCYVALYGILMLTPKVLSPRGCLHSGLSSTTASVGTRTKAQRHLVA